MKGIQVTDAPEYTGTQALLLELFIMKRLAGK
jgi:hypothetical protein